MSSYRFIRSCEGPYYQALRIALSASNILTSFRGVGDTRRRCARHRSDFFAILLGSRIADAWRAYWVPTESNKTRTNLEVLAARPAKKHALADTTFRTPTRVSNRRAAALTRNSDSSAHARDAHTQNYNNAEQRKFLHDASQSQRKRPHAKSLYTMSFMDSPTAFIRKEIVDALDDAQDSGDTVEVHPRAASPRRPLLTLSLIHI